MKRRFPTESTRPHPPARPATTYEGGGITHGFVADVLVEEFYRD